MKRNLLMITVSLFITGAALAVTGSVPQALVAFREQALQKRWDFEDRALAERRKLEDSVRKERRALESKMISAPEEEREAAREEFMRSRKEKFGELKEKLMAERHTLHEQIRKDRMAVIPSEKK